MLDAELAVGVPVEEEDLVVDEVVLNVLEDESEVELDELAPPDLGEVK